MLSGRIISSTHHFPPHTYIPPGNQRCADSQPVIPALSDNEPLSLPFLARLSASFPLCPLHFPLFAGCCCLSLMASSAAVPHVAREVCLCLLAGGTEGDNNVLMVPTTTPHRCRRHDSYSLVLPIVHPAFHPSHKERGAAPSEGVHSCHFSNANREPRNTSLPLFDVNSTNTHRHTLAQMSTQPCFPVPPPHVQLLYLFPSTHIGFLSVPACYLLKELSGSASLTEGRYNLWGVSGSLEKTMHSQTCSAPAKRGQQISFSYCQSRERAHHSNVAH